MEIRFDPLGARGKHRLMSSAEWMGTSGAEPEGTWQSMARENGRLGPSGAEPWEAVGRGG